MRLVWQLLAVAAVALIGGQVVAGVQDNPWPTLLIGVVTAVLAVLVYGWVVRRTEHRPSTEVEWPGAPAALGRGLLIGVALFSAVIVNLYAAGLYHFHGRGSVTGAVGLIGFMAAAALTEELMFRGVLFRIMEEHIGTWITLLVTSVLFGAWHLLNPDASLRGAVFVAIEAGPMLGAAYVATRKLWVPMGLHFGWNFAAAGIFSTEVSGNGSNQGLFDTSTSSGSQLITGGEFGPEGSVYSLAFGLATAIVFMWLAHRRGHLMPRGGRAEQVDATTTLAR